MALANGYHVTIGPYDFMLDEAIGGPASLIRPHYLHSYQSLLTQRVDVTGAPGKTNLRPEIILWDADDWSGGESNDVFDSQAPTLYNTGRVMPRSPGFITAPPTRTDATVEGSLTANLDTVGFLRNADANIWFASNHATNSAGAKQRVLRYSSNGTTWTSRLASLEGVAAFVTAQEQITALAADPKYIYVATIDRGANNRCIYRGSSSTAFVRFSTTEGASIEHRGLAVLDQFLYGWTGSRLFQYDITSALTTASTKVDDTGAFSSADPLSGTFYADAVGTDNSVCYFFGRDGQSEVREFKGGVGSRIWTGMEGFTLQAIGFAQDVLYMAGQFTNTLEVYAINLSSREQFVVSPPGGLRPGTNLTPVSIKPGIGPQVLIGTKEGYVFVYDAERDSISELDERTDLTRLLAVGTFRKERIAVFSDTPGLAFKSSDWDLDPTLGDTSTTNGTFTAISQAWDMDLPMEKNKVLLGFHVRSDTLSATKTVLIEHKINEAGGFTTAGTVSSGTDNFITVSAVSPGATTTFGFLRWRVTGTASGGSAAPKVFAVVPRAYNWNWVETWEIVVLLNKEYQNTGFHGDEPGAVRDFLLAQMENRTIVTFVDGYRYADASAATKTASVTVEDVQDIIDHNGEGFCRLTLRTISP